MRAMKFANLFAWTKLFTPRSPRADAFITAERRFNFNALLIIDSPLAPFLFGQPFAARAGAWLSLGDLISAGLHFIVAPIKDR